MTSSDGQAQLVLTTKHTPLAFFLYFTKIRIEIDGADAQIVPWGQQSVPVPAGSHEVKVWFKYLTKGRTGEATINVDTPAGSVVTLSYKAPYLMTSRGKLARTS
jgi:hypothetical protein